MTPAFVGSVGGHFGELLQGRLGHDGPVVLVTLPAPELRATARLMRFPPHRLGTGSSRVELFSLYCAGGEWPLAKCQALTLHRALTGAPARGRLVIRAGMPVGGGAGSSTAALLAAAAVFAASAGCLLPEPDGLARLCLALEGATDPLMHPEAGRLLWAPRQARALALLPRLPPLEVVGGFFGPGVRTDPTDGRFADVADLVAAWGPAAGRGDAAALAALATESARRNARVRGGPDLCPLLAAGDRLGALGVVAAHTGSARGLIFAPGHGPAEAEAVLRGLGLRAVVRFRLR